jgi:hypothetical protein
VREISLGALAMASLVAGLFFLRFWRDGRDRFFLFFAVAFGLMGVHWAALGTIEPGLETSHQVYWIRLVAFLLIVVGVLDKNRRSRGSP